MRSTTISDNLELLTSSQDPCDGKNNGVYLSKDEQIKYQILIHDLELIGIVQIDQTINVKSKKVIDRDKWGSAVIRGIMGESRLATFKFVRSTIDGALNFIETHYPNVNIIESDLTQQFELAALITSLKRANDGVLNLGKTYPEFLSDSYSYSDKIRFAGLGITKRDHIFNIKFDSSDTYCKDDDDDSSSTVELRIKDKSQVPNSYQLLPSCTTVDNKSNSFVKNSLPYISLYESRYHTDGETFKY